MNTVRLMNIQHPVCDIELENQSEVLLPPTVSLSLTATEASSTSCIVRFQITYSLATITNKPILQITTISTFSVPEGKHSFTPIPKEPLVNLLCHLATLTLHHSYGSLAVVAAKLSIPQTSLFSLLTPNDFQETILDALKSDRT